MTEVNSAIAGHYGSNDLYDRIVAGLVRMGKTAEALTPEDLKPVDEFHIGGAEATAELLAQVDIGPETAVLDIGSGIGGTSRFMTLVYGARVTGLDLTPEYVDTARRLSALVGLSADFRVGSALDMPFDDGSFDLATLVHVGMNLPDKARLFAEAMRVLRPGGSFVVYDVMRVGDGHPEFPLPWATEPAQSFLDTPSTYRDAAGSAGFTSLAERQRGDYARDFFDRLAASLNQEGPPPVGVGLLMGDTAKTKIANMVKSVGAGDIAPVEMIFRAPK